MGVYIYIYIYIYVCAYIYIYICIYMCIYIYIYVCLFFCLVLLLYCFINIPMITRCVQIRFQHFMFMDFVFHFLLISNSKT